MSFPLPNGDKAMRNSKKRRPIIKLKTVMPSRRGLSSPRSISCTMVACFIGAFLTPLDQPNAAAQALLYDNTDHTRFYEDGRSRMLWVAPGGGSNVSDSNWFNAQPFKIGNHDNVASVSINLARNISAMATGTVRISLWDDNGRGFPGQEVGELGVLDPTTLEIFDFPALTPTLPDSLPLVTFDSPIDDLARGETYYVVMDYRGIDPFDGDVLWGVSNSAVGSNRPGELLVTDRTDAVPPLEDSDWTPISQYFVHISFSRCRSRPPMSPTAQL